MIRMRQFNAKLIFGMYNYFCEIEKPQLRLVSAKIAMETIFGQNLLLFSQCYSAIMKTSFNYLVL